MKLDKKYSHYCSILGIDENKLTSYEDIKSEVSVFFDSNHKSIYDASKAYCELSKACYELDEYAKKMAKEKPKDTAKDTAKEITKESAKKEPRIKLNIEMSYYCYILGIDEHKLTNYEDLMIKVDKFFDSNFRNIESIYNEAIACYELIKYAYNMIRKEKCIELNTETISYYYYLLGIDEYKITGYEDLMIKVDKFFDSNLNTYYYDEAIACYELRKYACKCQH